MEHKNKAVQVEFGHFIYLVLKAMALSLITFALLMPCQQAMNYKGITISVLKSKKLKKSSEKFLGWGWGGVPTLLAENLAMICQSQLHPVKHFLWHLGQKLLMIFQQAWPWVRRFTSCTWPKYLPRKPGNE